MCGHRGTSGSHRRGEPGVADAENYKQFGNAVIVGAGQYVSSLLFAAGGAKWGPEIQLELPSREGS